MEKKASEVVFILDESGSMGGLESDTIGGYNALLNEQKKKEKEGEDIHIWTILFNNARKILHDRAKSSEIVPLTSGDYRPGGCTALLDAIGETIDDVSRIHKYLREEDVPSKVLFVITTDGLENASRKYGSTKVKTMIKAKQEEGWEFLFLGANIDAVETAEHLGIRKERAVNFHNDSRGIRTNFRVLTKAVSAYCDSGEISDSWSNDIKEDFKVR